MQADLEEVLTRMEIEYGRFSYQFDNTYEDEYFSRNFGKVISDGGFDAVISFNFWPLVSKSCYDAKIPYISWVYDCPIAARVEDTFSYPTNYVFLFDKAQYNEYVNQGYETVYHLPLAVNVERLENLYMTGEDKTKYTSQVSFVGNMYRSDYMAVREFLSEYEKGYLEGVIETQSRVYGYWYVNEILEDEFLAAIKERLEKDNKIKRENDQIFRKWVLGLVGREITRRERLILLSTISNRYELQLYSTEQDPLLPNTRFCGTVDSFFNLPKVFHLSKINLNISFKQITVGMPLRALEILGAGGLLFSNYQEELVENFRPGEEFVMYENAEDAIEKVKYYLEHEDERQEIAKKGHEAVKRFSYENQLAQIFKIVFGD